ncbi:Scr1 family TA system antitoxin-like transcriptional regulator [Streptomyces sp. NPDC018000]|uniref:Scr1 family TA system antitoxin-like transcriptional regulator n=1 Tax=Streptomyces sp. NPDC018000 TaxID=3365028 RepID=UPI0037911853
MGAYPGSGQTILYMHGSAPRLDTVSLDQSHGPVLVDAEAELEAYRLLPARMEAVALAPTRSMDFVRKLANEL